VSTPPLERKPALFATFKAVLWAFLGVRRRSDYEKDVQRLNPLHLMAMGVVLALMFVGGLILLVNWVVKT
jgi:hypothetical protein